MSKLSLLLRLLFFSFAFRLLTTVPLFFILKKKVIASIIIDNAKGGGTLNDQCAWYGMCYLVDTTLGLILAIWGLKILDHFAHKNDWASLKHSGVYEGVDGVLHWVHQVLAWLFILTVVKVIIYFFMVLCSEGLAFVGAILFAPLQSNIRFELLFVMIFFPGFLNVIYFWIADSFLQAKPDRAEAHEDEESPEMTDKKESLLTDEDKKEADDYDPTKWADVENSNQQQQQQQEPASSTVV